MTESVSSVPFHTIYATNGMIYFFTVSRHADENGEETGKCKRVDANKQGIEDFLFTLWITRSHFHCVVSCRHTSTKNRTDFDQPTFSSFLSISLLMFAIRSAVAVCRSAMLLAPSIQMPFRCFAEATSTPQEEKKPEEQGDPEVIDFIKKVCNSLCIRHLQIVKENKVMLFMKGTPSNPVCGFSYRVVQILKHLGELLVPTLICRLRLCKCKYSDE